jgi:WD40 repeat protein
MCLQEEAFLHARKLFTIRSLAWCPDGRSLAISGFGKTVRILDASTLGTRRVYGSHRPRMGTFCWSPDSQLVASVGGEGQVHVWQAATGNRLLCLPLHNAHTVAWSPNGTLLAAASWTGALEVWRAHDGRHIASFHLERVTWNTAIHGCRLAWSPNGERIAWATRFDVYVWSPFTGRLERQLRSRSFTYPYALSWSPDGDRLAVTGMPARVGTNLCVEIWRPVEERVALTYSAPNPHEDFVEVAWSPDGQRIASSGFSPAVHVWHAATGGRVAEYAGHKGLVTALGWSPDSATIASGGRDGFVRIWRPDAVLP